MPTSDELTPGLTGALKRVLEHLAAEDAAEDAAAVPDELDAQLRLFQRLNGERGRGAVAGSLGLQEAEVPFLGAAMRDVERTSAAATGGAPDAERNALLARMRLLSWLETIGQRTPGLALQPHVEAAVSEDLGRKQVRAVELIVRSLITESYGDQDALIARLREALDERVVQKWTAQADAGDILTGCTFSELASLFVNKQEFARYEELYEDTPFLTLLKQKRRTIQTFLDDIRRVRNVLAHNKRVTPIQLTLLDLYYEEIVAPVQIAHDHGETRVDPALHLDVSREELEGFVAGLHEDVETVRDDLAELRASVMASLGGLEQSTARIEDQTRGLHRKLYYGAAALVALIALTVYLVSQGAETQETTEQARAAAERGEAVGRETAARTKETAETTKEVADTTKKTAADVKSVKESTEKVVQTLDELRAGFATLTQSGGIIADARRPQEHYHNARLYEQRGEQAKALQSYRAYFSHPELEFVDPHLRFQSFLRLQQGAAGAREVYYEMKKDSQNPALLFAWNLLLDGGARGDGMDAFLEAHPGFAPAVYARSRDFSVARLGSQSMADRLREKELLRRFLELKEKGPFLRYYLEQAVASRQVKDAEERMALLSTISDEVMKNPVSLTGMRSQNAWMITLSIIDLHKEILYRVGKSGAFKSTGFLPHKNFQTGLPMAKPMFEIPLVDESTTLEVKYTDVHDKVHGPYALEFDPEGMTYEYYKNMLEYSKSSWLTFGGDDNQYLYFSTVLTYRPILKEVRYGLNADVPDRTFPVSPVDLHGPMGIEGQDTIYLEVKPSAKFATVQLFFKDGTKSEVVRVDRK